MATLALPNGINALTSGGGSGPLTICIPGWPQTAEAFTLVAPIISRSRRVVILDPPGLGASSPASSYDTVSIAKLLHHSLSSSSSNLLPSPSTRFHLVGHDIGSWIAFAYACLFPSSILSLSLLDANIPGLGPEQPLMLPEDVNIKLWQWSFNRLPDLPEILTRGREREYFDWLFDNKSRKPERLTRRRRDTYVAAYSAEGAMSRGFAYYRAVERSVKQHRELIADKGKLKMPILALGGEAGMGAAMKRMVEGWIGDDVRGGVVEDCGHYVMEEQPEIVGRWLLAFFEEVEDGEAKGTQAGR